MSRKFGLVEHLIKPTRLSVDHHQDHMSSRQRREHSMEVFDNTDPEECHRVEGVRSALKNALDVARLRTYTFISKDTLFSVCSLSVDDTFLFFSCAALQ